LHRPGTVKSHGAASDRAQSPSGPNTAAQSDCDGASTGFYLWSAIAIPAVALFFATDVYFYHYFFVFCPLVFVLIARWILPWRRTLLGLVLAQALMAIIFLLYIHENGGCGRGEYGLCYGRQTTVVTRPDGE
jgi:hypothetical protein